MFKICISVFSLRSGCNVKMEDFIDIALDKLITKEKNIGVIKIIHTYPFFRVLYYIKNRFQVSRNFCSNKTYITNFH